MSKFKVGDVVAVYSSEGRKVALITSFERGSTRIGVSYSGVALNDIVYPQQCRRLIKKPRRRVWVAFAGENEPTYVTTYNSNVSKHGWIEFIEVKKPKELK